MFHSKAKNGDTKRGNSIKIHLRFKVHQITIGEFLNSIQNT